MNFNVCVAVMLLCVSMEAAMYHGIDKRVLLSKRLLTSAQNAGEAQMTGGQDYNKAERLEFIEDALMWLVDDFGEELTTDQLLAFVRVFAFLDKLAAEEAESMSTETTAEEPTSLEEASTEETTTEGVSDEETTTEGVSTEEATTQEASVEETTTEEASVEETTEENETTPNTSDMERRLVKSLLMKLVQKKLNSLN